MRKIKVYVASSFDIKDRAKEVINMCERAGLEVTHDWTQESWEGLSGVHLENQRRKNAIEDFEGAQNADWLIFLNSPKGCGCWTEFGIALGSGRKCVIVQAMEPGFLHNIFVHLPGVFWAASGMAAVKQILVAERITEEEI